VPHTLPLPGPSRCGPIALLPWSAHRPDGSAAEASPLWKTHLAHALLLLHTSQHSLQLSTRLDPTFACGQLQSLAGCGHVFVGGSGGGGGGGGGGNGGGGGGDGPGGSPAQWMRPFGPSSLGSQLTVVPLAKLREYVPSVELRAIGPVGVPRGFPNAGSQPSQPRNAPGWTASMKRAMS
jgi:hypothetical protein